MGRTASILEFSGNGPEYGAIGTPIFTIGAYFLKSETNRLFSGILKRIIINSDFYRTAIKTIRIKNIVSYLNICRILTIFKPINVIRLQKDHLVERVGEFVENGTTKAKYKKTGVMML